MPTEFISSKDNRSKHKTMGILDIMDEEDMGQTIAGVNLLTKKSYDTFGDNQKSQQKKEFGSSAVLGEAIDDMFIESKDSVGYKILEN